MSTPARPRSPSLDDPLAAAATESIGGPIGRRAAPHPWWTPVRVVLAVCAVALGLAMLQKTPCVQQHWAGGNQRYAEMCYSDIPYLYTDRGFAERLLPYSDTGGRYQALEYPVTIGYVAYDTALVTQWLRGWPDVRSRGLVSEDRVYAQPGVPQESWLYFEVTAVVLAGFALLAAWFLAGTHRGRPWDAMAFAAAPALMLAGLINWDLIAVAAVAGALWSWSRGRPVLAGAFIGAGVATKLFPVFLLGALFVVCLRRRELGAFAKATLAAVAAWLALNLPAMLYGFDQWKVFWTFNRNRGADLGSVWLVWQQAGHHVTAREINLASWVFVGAVCVGVLVLGLCARRTPRIPQLALLVLVGFLVVNKVY
ncbi:MAG: glycosyltransferase 87 family protein [Nocardioidaceae bacterium]